MGNQNVQSTYFYCFGNSVNRVQRNLISFIEDIQQGKNQIQLTNELIANLKDNMTKYCRVQESCWTNINRIIEGEQILVINNYSISDCDLIQLEENQASLRNLEQSDVLSLDQSNKRESKRKDNSRDLKYHLNTILELEAIQTKNQLIYKQVLEYISNEMQKKINVLYLIKLFCLNSLKMKFNDDKLNKLCPEIMNNLELSIGFDSVDFMEYQQSFMQQFTITHINQYLAFFLKDNRKCIRILRKFFQLLIDQPMNEQLAQQFNDANLTIFSTNLLYLDKELYSHYYQINLMNFHQLNHRINQILYLTIEIKTPSFLQKINPNIIFTTTIYKDAIQEIKILAKLHSPFLKLKLLQRVQKLIDQEHFRIFQQDIHLSADDQLSINEYIYLKSGLPDFVVHLKMIDNLLLKSFRKGKLCSILTNWWVCLLGMQIKIN